MKRKIIKQGHNTLTLTLPREWIKRLNLRAGEEIDVVENEDSLIVNGHQNTKKNCAVIDITHFSVPLLWRYMQSAYRSGCDEIKIVFDPTKKEYADAFHFYTTQFEYANLGEKVPPKTAKAMIQDVANRFVGIDVVEFGKDYCLIKEVAEVSPKEFDSSLRKIFLVIFELFNVTLDVIEREEIKNAKLCKDIHNTDLNIDRSVDYCARILNRITGIMPERKKSLVFTSLFLLELIGDEFKYIAKHFAQSKKPFGECEKIARLVKEHFELYYKLFYKFDRETALKFGNNDVAVYKEHFKTKDKFHGEAKSVAKHLMMISKFTLSLVELRIQMEF
ncbi:MAG: AbrB/MazE/SpoVT family DNA-binding domain-containing protein [Nanoarchaeota archaeon]|nr:AbrB/MazE/SpoVT family DNA-binding domain-containing protein [Nanoarchaeota archaeon]MBU0977660.1 AbrB/MazE/SpoVT family DNA-binding domain-containing protein [Nanoarchaeota archaeon]